LKLKYEFNLIIFPGLLALRPGMAEATRQLARDGDTVRKYITLVEVSLLRDVAREGCAEW
jgi:hypothetical protein